MKTKNFLRVIATGVAILAAMNFAEAQSSTPIWAARSATSGLDEGNDIHVVPYGNCTGGDVFVCGQTGATNTDGWLARYDKNGNIYSGWPYTWNNTSGNGTDVFYALAHNPSAHCTRVWVCGKTWNGTTQGYDIVVQLIVNGLQQWSTIIQSYAPMNWNFLGDDAALAMDVYLDHYLLVTGYVRQTAGGSPELFVAYLNGDTGTLECMNLVGCGGSTLGTGYDVDVYFQSSPGTLYGIVAGYCENPVQRDIILIKFEASGVTDPCPVACTNVFDYGSNNAGDDEGYSVAVKGSNAFVAGKAYVNTTNLDDGFLGKYDLSNCSLSNSATWNNSSWNNNDRFNSVAPRQVVGTYVFVTGTTSQNATESNYVTQRYTTANLTFSWSSQYNGSASPSLDKGYMLQVSPVSGDRVYVSGVSEVSGQAQNYTTVRYAAATGAQQWVGQYNRNNLHDEPDARFPLAVIDDGCSCWPDEVHVTGGSTDQTANLDDIATVKWAVTGTCNCNGPEGGGRIMGDGAPFTFCLFPSPVKTTATFRYGNGETVYLNASFIVYDLTGRTVKQVDNINEAEFTVDCTNLLKGMYFYKFAQSNNILATGKFVIAD